MSEMKAFRIIQGDTGGYGTPSYKCDTDGNSIEEWSDYDEVYLKSEADKVIAELNDKLQNVSELLKETREWLVESQKLHKRCADNAGKIIRHHKYKRCLAVARWCERERIDAANYRIPRETWEFYDKWHRRWFKIAEQFKEAK